MVSVIIPTYNSAEFISRAIDSVIDDSLVGEVFIVDDASTDNTVEVINQYLPSSEKLILLTQSKNQGACAARNIGLKHAKYDWIQFLDSDDVILKGKFQRQLKLASNGNVDLIVGSYYRIENGLKTQVNPLQKDIFQAFTNYAVGNTNSNLWKKEFLIKIGGWREDWPSGQDYEIVLRALKSNSSIKFDNEPSSEYIKRSGSISNTGSNRGWQTQIMLRLDLADYLFESKLMNIIRSVNLHRVIYNKLVLLKRVEELKDEYEALNSRFLSSQWYSFTHVLLGSPKALLYFILGFKIAEKAIRLIKK
ncbi:glycosyltransferase family 2 protein [Algoriphagus antarcticus]|uniref:Glycosyl transferase family 2 n=1 Tax=Algoriphagus antarcticus TaxID=238540 RepID=A0A3E0E1B1_9BACT|nr:glycosyltransferase family 2 protein [Algoriphagus antarcticus]REG91523.1 glycosyl transferase family 2 [Algoriphagus antarcticus]